jgi:hypothetical protein
LSVASGLWNTTSSKQPALIKSGEFAGLANPADIRGSYTYRDVLKSFTIPESVILQAFKAHHWTNDWEIWKRCGLR